MCMTRALCLERRAALQSVIIRELRASAEASIAARERLVRLVLSDTGALPSSPSTTPTPASSTAVSRRATSAPRTPAFVQVAIPFAGAAAVRLGSSSKARAFRGRYLTTWRGCVEVLHSPSIEEGAGDLKSCRIGHELFHSRPAPP
ncbi:unnamed protein product [Sphagnum tenellum]